MRFCLPPLLPWLLFLVVGLSFAVGRTGAQTFITGDNSTVVGCSNGCAYTDPSLECWNRTLFFFERLLLAQMRHYVAIQMNIDQWHRRQKGVPYTPKFKEAKVHSIAAMKEQLQPGDIVNSGTIEKVVGVLIDLAARQSNRTITWMPHYSCPIPCEYRYTVWRNLFIASTILNVCLFIAVRIHENKQLQQRMDLRSQEGLEWKSLKRDWVESIGCRDTSQCWRRRMNRLSMDLSEMALNMQPCEFDEETWLMAAPSPKADRQSLQSSLAASEYDGKMAKGGGAGVEGNLDEWLEGALRKVDFRTRSALTRRLEKKRLKQEIKQERLPNGDHLLPPRPLTRIEEVSGESLTSSVGSSENLISPVMRMRGSGGPLSSSRSMNAAIGTSDMVVVDEVFYDASSTPATGRQPKTSREETYATPREYTDACHSTARTDLCRTERQYPTPRGTNNPQITPQETGHIDVDVIDDLMNLGEIERLAREQEEELRRELLTKRDRLFSHNCSEERRTSNHELHHDPSSVNHSPRPTFSSSASSASPFVHNSGGSMATSKSADFRQHTPHSPNQETDSNGAKDSLARTNTPMSSSRIPMPRRPTVAGKTSIPMPVTTVKTPRGLHMKEQSIDTSSTPHSSTLSVHSNEAASTSSLHDDKECF